MEYCIVYTSSFIGLLSGNELDLMRQQGQYSNRALGITGILLYYNGSVIHVLEGPEEVVKRQYAAYQQDYRQTPMIKLYDKQIEHRSFSDWLMGYKAPSNNKLNHLLDLLPFLKEPYFPWSRQDNVILSLLHIFHLTNYRN